MGLEWSDSSEKALSRKGNPMTFESRTWGETNFRKSGTLESVVKELPPNVKQAMYAAANRGLIKRGTWDGCAFNAGSLEVCDDVSGVRNSHAAAQFFAISVDLVSRFISTWDSVVGTDEACTERLRTAILDAGLFSEPNESRGRRVMRQTVWKSEETRMREEFEALVENLDLDASAEESPLAYATTEIGVLLSV